MGRTSLAPSALASTNESGTDPSKLWNLTCRQGRTISMTAIGQFYFPGMEYWQFSEVLIFWSKCTKIPNEKVSRSFGGKFILSPNDSSTFKKILPISFKMFNSAVYIDTTDCTNNRKTI